MQKKNTAELKKAAIPGSKRSKDSVYFFFTVMKLMIFNVRATPDNTQIERPTTGCPWEADAAEKMMMKTSKTVVCVCHKMRKNW